MDSSTDRKAKVSGKSAKTPPDTSPQSTVSTIANSTDSQEDSSEHVTPKVEKRTRFVVDEDEVNNSRDWEAKSTRRFHRNSLPTDLPSTNQFSKFSCCNVDHPSAPIADPFSLLQANASDKVLSNRNQRLGIHDATHSNFVLLDNYGYDVKYTGPLIRINISGTVFVIKASTLQRDQVVFDKFLEDAEFLADTKEYYFERDPVVFRFVHAYLRNQEMHLPLNICGPLLEKELEAWGIQLGLDLQRCCLGPVMETKSKMESLRSFEETFSENPEDWHFKPK